MGNKRRAWQRYTGPTPFLLLTAMASLFLPARSSDDRLSSLLNGTLDARRQAIHTLFGAGKEAIPALIDEIRSKERVANQLTNPCSSIMLEGNLKICRGAYAAYFIELILAKERLEIGLPDDHDLLLGSERNYIFWEGFIADATGKCISHDCARMETIAAIYRAWWQQNGNKPLSRLREEWKRGQRPLAGSAFYWE